MFDYLLDLGEDKCISQCLTMPFQKGNKLGQAPKAKAEAWNNIVGWLAGQGGSQFQKLVADLSSGKEIKPPQVQFLDYYLQLLEYHQPKRSRLTVAGDPDAPIQFMTLEEIRHRKEEALKILNRHHDGRGSKRTA